jgi:hypothetical protein
MDWEQWLRESGAPPSDTEDEKRKRTEQQVREALQKHPALQGKAYSVYAKGSYANTTNVRLNYDVDIAVEYRGYFYSDLCFDLAGQPQSAVGVVDSQYWRRSLTRLFRPEIVIPGRRFTASTIFSRASHGHVSKHMNSRTLRGII